MMMTMMMMSITMSYVGVALCEAVSAFGIMSLTNVITLAGEVCFEVKAARLAARDLPREHVRAGQQSVIVMLQVTRVVGPSH